MSGTGFDGMLVRLLLRELKSERASSQRRAFDRPAIRCPSHAGWSALKGHSFSRAVQRKGEGF